jgi:hypothetical protein
MSEKGWNLVSQNQQLSVSTLPERRMVWGKQNKHTYVDEADCAVNASQLTNALLRLLRPQSDLNTKQTAHCKKKVVGILFICLSVGFRTFFKGR